MKENFVLYTRKLVLAFAFSIIFLLIGTQSVFASDISTNVVVDPGGGMPVYQGTSTAAKSGDILYTNKLTTTWFTGHVAIVAPDGYVYHTPGAGNPGIKKMSVYDFITTYDDVQVWRAKSSTRGQNAGFKAQSLYGSYRYADYSVYTTLTGDFYDQYCTKFVWQSYYYGANTNLDSLSLTKLTVPPHWILDGYYLTKIHGGL
ncbi:hypothetical protein BN1058_00681 [Paraliobacillus sp. PM-2]|uniref:hypothetical protein n=1 Tax=Paraliobacillus sp. PM-2 TaxID=1462524 RepID=UPI00061C8602|nr:hypothetical protein [Paraliobacillus sp. PM-2]CQR46421.1 hypothetical protein BN1058_00681 [Paraliobacillus sp. PM-2]